LVELDELFEAGVFEELSVVAVGSSSLSLVFLPLLNSHGATGLESSQSPIFSVRAFC